MKNSWLTFELIAPLFNFDLLALAYQLIFYKSFSNQAFSFQQGEIGFQINGLESSARYNYFSGMTESKSEPNTTRSGSRMRFDTNGLH